MSCHQIPGINTNLARRNSVRMYMSDPCARPRLQGETGDHATSGDFLGHPADRTDASRIFACSRCRMCDRLSRSLCCAVIREVADLDSYVWEQRPEEVMWVATNEGDEALAGLEQVGCGHIC